MHTWSPGLWNAFRSFESVLRDSGLFKQVLLAGCFRNGFRGRLYNDNEMKAIATLIPDHCELVCFNWNEQLLFDPNFRLLRKARNITLVEDAATISPSSATLAKRLAMRAAFGERVLAPSSTVDNVYVTETQHYLRTFGQSRVHPIIEFTQPKAMTTENLEYIKDVFDCPTPSNAGAGTIILTQPLANDIKRATVAEQIAIYQAIIDRFPSPVFLKKHPRDDIIYPFSDEVQEISRFTPQELITELGFHFEYAVGLSSTAIEATNSINKVMIYPEIYEHWDAAQVLRLIEEFPLEDKTVAIL